MKKSLKFIETSNLPTDLGEFKVHAFTEEKEKVFDPKEVYGNSPNPTKL